MKPSAPVLAMLAVALAGGAAPAAEFQQTFTFREPLGATWTEELVHQDVRIGEARVAAKTFALFDADGKPAPVQVEVLEGRPDAVRRARVWLTMTLPRDREVAWRLTYRDDGREADRPGGEGAAVRREEGRLVLSTGAAEVRVAAPPGPLEKAATFDAAPAPLLGVRAASDGPWFGRFALAGPARVKAVETTVAAAGPVWAEVHVKYVQEDKAKSYEVVLRAVRGEPYIEVAEKYRLSDGCRLTLDLDDALRPSEMLWMPWAVRRGGKVEAAYEVRRDRLGESARGDEPLATLRPRWTQAPGSAQVCLAVGPGGAVGAVMLSPAAWARPYEQFVTVRAPAGQEGMVMEFPLAEGSRRWALLAGPVARFDTKAKLQGLIRRAADIPLDRVLNEWVFRWDRDPAQAAPHILTTPQRLARLREDVAAEKDTAAARLVRAVVAGDRPGDREVADFLAGRRDRLSGPTDGAVMFLGRSYQDDFLSPASYPSRLAAALPRADLSSAGRPAGDAAHALLGYVFSDPNYWPGYAGGWDVGDPSHHADMPALAVYAAAMMPDHPHAKRWMEVGLGALREDLRRSVVMPGGAGQACPAAQAASLGAVLPVLHAAGNSGLADPWAWPEVRASVEFLRNLHTPPDPRLGRRTLAPLGDAPAWQDAVGQVFGMAAAGLRRADPKLAAVWMGLYRHYYGEAGSGDLVRDVLLVDPSAPVGLLSDAGPGAEAAPWGSRRYDGFGAVFRSRFGTPRETFAALKCGPSRGACHGDELAFHFYGAGTPLALDWSCGDTPRPDQEHMHNRVNLGEDENMDAAGELLAVETGEAGDLAVGQVRSNRLRRLPRYPHEIAPGASFPRRTLNHQARYRRMLLLVKHGDGPVEDYLVIRDEVASAEPATFNLFVLARSVRQEGQAFCFDGQLSADAVLFMATPQPDKVTLSRWAWPRQDESAMIPETFDPDRERWRQGELQQWVRVTETPGRPFLAVLYPVRRGGPAPTFQTLADGKGVRVTVGPFTEDVYLATDPAPEAGGQAVIRRGDRTHVLLNSKALPAL